METDAAHAMEVDEPGWDDCIIWPGDDAEVLLAIDIDTAINDLIDGI